MRDDASPAATIPGMTQVRVPGNREQLQGFAFEHALNRAGVRQRRGEEWTRNPVSNHTAPPRVWSGISMGFVPRLSPRYHSRVPWLEPGAVSPNSAPGFFSF